jgi:transcriptional regulator with XRE-family HTH domain
MSDVPATIARRVKALRIERGWSLDQVAKKVGCTKSHVWEIEQGRSRNPTIALVQGFASAFGVPLSEIIGSDTEKPRVPAHLAEAISAVKTVWETAWQAGYEAGQRDAKRSDAA